MQLPFPSEYLAKPKFKKVKPPPAVKELDLSQFAADPQPQYIGQNVYIKPNYIVSVPEFSRPKRLFSLARIANQKNLKDNKHKNKLSPKAIKRIQAAINWLCVSSVSKSVYSQSMRKTFNFKVNLITLTLPDTDQPVTDHVLKSKLLHNWLVYMRKFHKLNNYVWKVEFHKNGKLHVHITTDTFIEHHVIRHVWNRILKNHGLMEDFRKKFKHENPNSTDVHAVWKVENLAAYLAKYLSKNEQSAASENDKNNNEERNLNGRIWGCNWELSAKNKCHVFINRDECHAELRCLMNPEIDYKECLNQDKITGKVFKLAELFFIKPGQWLTHINGVVQKTFQDHCFKIRHGLGKGFVLDPV